MNVPLVKLNNGTSIPQLGLGTSQMKSPEETVGVIKTAISLGYRLIDTATMYGNEREVGRGIAASGVPRADIVVTTKLWPDDFGDPENAFHTSLEKLGLEYVDIYLVHWPRGFRKEVWRSLESFVEAGLVRTIGISNFSINETEDMLSWCKIPPALNQIHCNPFNYDKELFEYSASKSIVLEAYRPLTRGDHINDSRIAGIAARCGKSAAQVMIRWGLQHGVVSIPKSTHPERLAENLDVFDFTIAESDMVTLDVLSSLS
jgi:diketogulonate reductase-like aldo/keto reductase